jgi:hypothetical protein
MSAPAVKRGGSAIYTVRLQNDSPDSVVEVPIASAPTCPGVTAKWTVNGIDQTANIQGGVVGWTVGAGAHKDLTLTLKYATAPAGCVEDLLYVGSTDGNGNLQYYTYIHLPIAAETARSSLRPGLLRRRGGS